jgi:hypothetical protein
MLRTCSCSTGYGFVLIPLIHPADDVILLYAVALLYFAHDLVAVALDLHEVVVLQFASVTFELSLGLAPPSFDSILTL